MGRPGGVNYGNNAVPETDAVANGLDGLSSNARLSSRTSTNLEH